MNATASSYEARLQPVRVELSRQAFDDYSRCEHYAESPREIHAD